MKAATKDELIYVGLTQAMIKLQTEARSLWHSGNKEQATTIGSVIGRIANARLKYIYH